MRGDGKADGRIALLDLLGPERAAAYALHDQCLVEAPNHVHVEACGDHPFELRVGFAGDHLGEVLDEMIAAEQAQFLTAPGDEHHIALHRQLALLLQIRQPLGDFDDASDTTRVVIRSVMNLVHLVALRARVAAAVATKMIDVRADDERRRVEVRLGLRGQCAEHVATGLLLLLDRDARAELQAFAIDATHEVAVVELVLKFLQRLACGLEQFIAHGVGEADRRNAGRGERGIELHGHELLHHLAVRSADDEQPTRTLLSCDHRLLPEAGVADQFVAALAVDALGQVAQHEHPLVLHVEVRVAAVRLDLLAVLAGRFVGCLDAVAGKDDVARRNGTGL